ncbi:c-type cytochrome [Phenylobacterium immobile]|uniref:c-type cytochrome n=1 Tax=Phenylobacterium immobile TaxID=21 RepID=UPI000AB24618|nr:cytochrome c [Phenylobacterium immobile]
MSDSLTHAPKPEGLGAAAARLGARLNVLRECDVRTFEYPADRLYFIARSVTACPTADGRASRAPAPFPWTSKATPFTAQGARSHGRLMQRLVSLNVRASAALALAAALAGADPACSAEAIAAVDSGQRAVARGERFARANCSGCHNIGSDDGAPYKAPPFRGLAQVVEGRLLLDRFATISAHGVRQMPPVTIPNQDVDDLAAYFDHLRDRPR